MVRRVSLLLVALCAAGLAAASLASAAVPPLSRPGDLDPTFGSGGSVRILPSNEDIALRGVAVQSDLKIVMAGSDITTDSVLLVRLLPNGSSTPPSAPAAK